MRFNRVLAVVVFGLVTPLTALAEFGDVLFELEHPRLGEIASVAVNDDYVLVGSGSRRVVYTFDVQSGKRLMDIELDTRVNGFGGSVDIFGSLAVVGGSEVEAAYVFDIATGQQIRKLVPDDPRDGQYFGGTVAIDGDIVLVGASFDDEHQDRGGAAYVFDVESGKQLYKLHPDVAVPRAGLIPLFGGALDLKNGTAVIGESNTMITDSNSAVGGAYVFDVHRGEQLSKLINPELPSSHDLFASSIDISDGRVVIGSSGTNDACPGLPPSCWSGAAFVFDIDSGEQIQKLTIEDGRKHDQLGARSVLEGDVAIVSGRNDASNAYFFDVTSGNELMRIPGGKAFSAANGKAVVTTGRQTFVVDIRAVPEPSSVPLLSLLVACFAIRSARRRNLSNHR